MPLQQERAQIMRSATERRTTISPASPAKPRLRMQQAAAAGDREHAPAITLRADETPASINPGVREWGGGQSDDREVVPGQPQPVSGQRFPRTPVAGLGSS
jgi:hypothetical protein